MKMKLRNGFTLLELLVVIAIIGILVSMGAVAFSTAQKKSRDSKRHGDVKAMQSAFEQYYAENGTYDTCGTMATAQYLPGGLPTDPKNTGAYVYSCNSEATNYCACALLEDADSGNANSPGVATSCTFASGGDYYCLGNLQ
jgi:prepilin-type N-terminal cleavage/methylation domain-containing protein